MGTSSTARRLCGSATQIINAHSPDKKFATIQPGMTRSQVIGILGKPTGFKSEPGAETLTWEAGNHYVKLRDGKVVQKGEE